MPSQMSGVFRVAGNLMTKTAQMTKNTGKNLRSMRRSFKGGNMLQDLKNNTAQMLANSTRLLQIEDDEETHETKDTYVEKWQKGNEVHIRYKKDGIVGGKYKWKKGIVVRRNPG